ncbi:MAG: acetylxylan esterase [Ruthenibacterium sp.]
MTPQTLSAYETYRGTNPCPADFDAFWAQRKAEAMACPLAYTFTDCAIKGAQHSVFQELHFTGIDGAKLYAKYIRPNTNSDVPLVLQFHGYPGATRSWLELASFAGLGCAMLALDCPGQGGLSEDKGGYQGSTVSGHLIAGLDGAPQDMYYVKLHQNIMILCRIAQEIDGIDRTKISVNGGSQGGALALACAALNPEIIHKAAILYPFLSDYQKIWEMDGDVIPYEGLRYYTRWFDPKGERTAEIFTKLGYIDTLNFAHLVRAQTLFGTGLKDVWCLPITQYGVYNNLQCSKKHVVFPDFGHEEIQAFDDMLLSFFAKEGL